MDAPAAPLFRPPIPPPPLGPLPLRQFLKTIRTNALMIWPENAYRQEVVERRFLGRNNLLLNAPDAIHHVLVGQHGNYRRSPASVRILRPITGQGLLLSEGESWKLQRRTIAPALAPRVLPLLCRHIAAVAQEAMTRLGARSGAPVDLLAEMQGIALEIAGRSMFSTQMGQYGAALRRLITEFGLNLARPHLFDMLLPPSIPTWRDLARNRFRQRWMGLIDGIMQARLREPEAETPRDLFDLLRAARDPETGRGFSPEELRDQAATLILAGHETTAVGMFWALALLAQVPEEQARLAREVAAADLSPEHAYLSLGDLPRTRAVVNEALRLFPPVFTLVREAIGPDTVSGIRVRRGDIMMIAPWVLHRHRVLWTDPDAFDPGRFMPGAPTPPRFAYLPFGAGPRVCVGAQFALAEAGIVLASVIQRFQVTLTDSRLPTPVAIVTTQPDHPPLFHLRPRGDGD